jgi:hypothetical protein
MAVPWRKDPEPRGAYGRHRRDPGHACEDGNRRLPPPFVPGPPEKRVGRMARPLGRRDQALSGSPGTVPDHARGEAHRTRFLQEELGRTARLPLSRELDVGRERRACPALVRLQHHEAGRTVRKVVFLLPQTSGEGLRTAVTPERAVAYGLLVCPRPREFPLLRLHPRRVQPPHPRLGPVPDHGGGERENSRGPREGAASRRPCAYHSRQRETVHVPGVSPADRGARAAGDADVAVPPPEQREGRAHAQNAQDGGGPPERLPRRRGRQAEDGRMGGVLQLGTPPFRAQVPDPGRCFLRTGAGKACGKEGKNV